MKKGEKEVNKITTIIFDAGGVLFDTKTSRLERITKTLSSRGFTSTEIARAYSAGEEFYQQLKNYKWLSTWADEEEFFDRYYEIIVDNLSTNDQYGLRKQLFHHTHFAVNCVLFDEVKEVLEGLYGHYKLGVISNAFPSMDWIFDLLDIRKYFDTIILSSKVGTAKPDPVIYQKALESLKVKADECIFIDDKKVNIAACEALGFTGIHLDRKLTDLKVITSYLDNNNQ